MFNQEELFNEMSDSIITINNDDPLKKILLKFQSVIVMDNYPLKPYLNTTQNQEYIRTLLNKNMKNALVILGGGDNIFQLSFNEIFDITAVDINPLQEYMFYLKLLALRTLSPSDYESFLLDSTNVKFLSKDVYNNIKDGFKIEEQLYKRLWDIMFKSTPQDELRKYMLKGGLENLPIDLARDSLKFVKKNSLYYRLRDNMEKTNFKIIIGDILEVLASSKDTYDFIDITNTLLFTHNDFRGEEFKKYVKHLKEVCDTKINENSILVLDYMFQMNRKLFSLSDKNIEQVFYTEIYEALRDEYNLEYLDVLAMKNKNVSPYNTDLVLYVKKITK